MKLLWLVPIGALGVALLDLPYGYYVLLRLLVCSVCAYLAVREWQEASIQWAWILGTVAVLYNPIIKLPIGHDLWPVVNIATIALLLFHMWARRTLSNQNGK